VNIRSGKFTMIVGFPSGALKNLFPYLSPEFFKALQDLGVKALEIHTSDKESLLKVLNLDLSLTKRLNYLALHLPSVKETEMEDLLPIIKEVHAKHDFKLMVSHTDIITDWSIFSNQGLPIALENMDHRKDRGKTVKDIKNILDKYDFKFVLDVNHCFVNDPSLKLVDEFITAFNDRLAEIHVSGYEVLHDPLSKTRQSEIVEKIAHINVPIIIECGYQNLNEARQELNYVKSFF